jgi:hypothetical protein
MLSRVEKKKASIRASKWNKENPKRHKEIHKAMRARRKLDVLTHYGPKGKLGCCWKGCKVIDIDMLSLDHMNNDGHLHLKNGLKVQGQALYLDVKNRNFPKGFQTLCHNHQQKKMIMLARGEPLV